MTNDRRVKRNQKNILNIHSLLIEICKKPENFDFQYYKNNLKSQKGLSQIEDHEREIYKSSINTLKRISPAVLEEGFEELDKLRIMAYEAICKSNEATKKSNKVTREGLSKRVEELEQQVYSLKKAHLLTINALSEDIRAFESILNSKSIDLTQKISEASLKRLRSFALLEPEFIDLKDDNKVIQINFGDKND